MSDGITHRKNILSFSGDIWYLALFPLFYLPCSFATSKIMVLHNLICIGPLSSFCKFYKSSTNFLLFIRISWFVDCLLPSLPVFYRYDLWFSYFHDLLPRYLSKNYSIHPLYYENELTFYFHFSYRFSIVYELYASNS